MTTRYSRSSIEQREAERIARVAQRPAEIRRLSRIPVAQRTARQQRDLTRYREARRAYARVERRRDRLLQNRGAVITYMPGYEWYFLGDDYDQSYLRTFKRSLTQTVTASQIAAQRGVSASRREAIERAGLAAYLGAPGSFPASPNEPVIITDL